MTLKFADLKKIIIIYIVYNFMAKYMNNQSSENMQTLKHGRRNGIFYSFDFDHLASLMKLDEFGLKKKLFLSFCSKKICTAMKGRGGNFNEFDTEEKLSVANTQKRMDANREKIR